MKSVVSRFAWFAGGVLVAAAIGRHAIERLFRAGEELSLTEDLLGRLDRADGLLFVALCVAVTFPRWERPLRAATLALLLGCGAVVWLPKLEPQIEQLGRSAWGWYGGRVAAGIDCAVELVLAAAVLGLASAMASDRRWVPLAAAGAATLVEGLVPGSALLPAAVVGTGAALVFGRLQ